MATFDTDQCVTDIKQTINLCFNPEASLFCSHVVQHSSPLTVDISGETIRLTISLRLGVEFLHVIYIKDKQMIIFILIFDFLWTGGGSSVSSVAFVGFLQIKQIEKLGQDEYKLILIFEGFYHA